MSDFQSNPNLSKVTSWEIYLSSISEEREATLSLYQEATEYLTFFSWCKCIKNAYVGILVPDVVGVFLFEIEPNRDGVDSWIWVIVGDLPPAYITCEDSPNPACALDAYIGAMTEWVGAARSGASVASLIPVNVAANVENADALDKRLTFLDQRILSGLKEDLGASLP
jgi:hypothetical protein